jgi:Ubiquitin 3 binding protein But2 C-terminal domain
VYYPPRPLVISAELSIKLIISTLPVYLLAFDNMKVTSLFTALLISCAVASPTIFPLEVIGERAIDERSICPSGGTLPKGYLSPTLMVPFSKNLPNTKFGSTKIPLITPNDFCTVFNLEIPASAVGKTCTLEFLFPNHLQTFAPYVYSGPGHFTFTGYAFGTGATLQTTYNHQPPAGPSPPSPPAVLSPGHAYTINVGDCGIQTGMTSLEVSGALCSTDTYFSYLQSSAQCPIGFYVAIS